MLDAHRDRRSDAGDPLQVLDTLNALAAILKRKIAVTLLDPAILYVLGDLLLDALHPVGRLAIGRKFTTACLTPRTAPLAPTEPSPRPRDDEVQR
ncbi:hypothetical protein [Caulobacter soli]|uniref:hypothetical protein n=1 Tax=Caulobacter soli TaxID=2708539 RepID=UPI0013ECB652|nr:hypothetical protein [Caulobacter soli]